MTNLRKTLRFLLNEGNDYSGAHQAPGKDGAPMWNVAGDVYPDDIYTLPLGTAARYYGSSEPGDIGLMALVRSVHNRPKARVRIFRAVPKTKTLEEKIQEIEDEKRYILKKGKLPKSAQTGLSPSEYYNRISRTLEHLKAQEKTEEPAQINKINPGDWVTPWRPYAVQHGRSSLRGEYRILSKTVPASELYTDGNSLYEFGWNP